MDSKRQIDYTKRFRHFIERHPEKKIEFAKLHVFYDKPKWNGQYWQDARDACEIKNYMFPEIGIGECIEFQSKTNEE